MISLKRYKAKKVRRLFRKFPIFILTVIFVFVNTFFYTDPTPLLAAAAQTRQEINILDGYLGAPASTVATSSEIISIDKTKYSGTVSYYFEIVASTSAAFSNTVTLRRAGNGTDDCTVTIPNPTTSYTLIRSSVCTLPTGPTDYVVRISSNAGGTTGVKAARIVILQNYPVSSVNATSTQTQIEIGNKETGKSNTTSSALSAPKYWKYDSSKWDGTLSFYAEVTYQNTQVSSSTIFRTATTSDTTMRTVTSAGISFLQVEAWGAGGGGGIGTAGGGGGGGGAYAKSVFATTTGSNNTLFIPKGGVTDTAASAGDATFNTTVVVADGGTGTTNLKGTGGTVANSTGHIEFAGGNGGDGHTTGDVGGGGGGAGGPDGAGVTASGAAASAPSAGGNADNGSGGAGGSQGTTNTDTCSTSGGKPGGSNVLGGGGGGGAGSDGTGACSGGTGGAPGGGGGSSEFANTTQGGGQGQIKLTEIMGRVGVAIEEDDGSFGSWTFKEQIVAGGVSTSTSARARSASFTPTTGRHYRIVASTTNSTATYDILNAKIIVDQTSASSFTLLEPQYLLANTSLSSGTSLQNFLTTWDSSEWVAVTNTYVHDVNAGDNSTSVVEVDTSGGTLVTGSSVSSPDNRGASGSVTMPSNQNLDVKATTNNSDVYASRILAQVSFDPPTPSITVASSVNQPTRVFKSTADNILGVASIIRSTGTGSVTAITLTENSGTINANTNMSNIELWLSYDNTWSAGDNQLGSTGSFDGANGSVTFTETFSATTTAQYLIVRGDIGSGASAGETMEIQFTTISTTDDVSGTPLEIGGTTTVYNPPTISSAANQSFSVGDGTTAISAITITDDATTATISSTTDIRITIPDSVDMVWDTADVKRATSSSALANYREKTFVTDMPTVTIDLSGVTYNPLTNTIFTVINGTPTIYEYSLTGTLLRTITMTGFIDTEGIAWMYGTTYAVTEERDPYDIVIVTIDTGTTSLTKAGGTTIDPQITFTTNLGFEGITYDPDNDWFYVVSEKPAGGGAVGVGGGRVFKINMDASYTEYTTLASNLLADGATDLADIAYDRASGHLLILSEEGNKIYETDTSGTIYTSTSTDSRFTQPEGLALSWDNDKMFVVSETDSYAYYTVGSATTTVSYENSGKTLVVDVTEDFRPGDSITISGLSFKTFGSATGPDNLDLIIDGAGGVVVDTDDKTKTIITPVQITVSGTLYSDEGSTQVTAGSNVVKMRVGTSTPGIFSTTTIAGTGFWQFNNITSAAAGTPYSIWIDGDPSLRAFTYTEASSTANNITGVDLYQNRVIVKHEATSAESVTNAELGVYDGDDDSDIKFSVSGTSLSVAKGQELHIANSKVFAPGGTVTLHGNAASTPDGDLHLDDNSTLTLGGAMSLAGNWTADSGSTFSPVANIITFTATTTGKTIAGTFTGNSASSSLTFNGSGGAWAMSSNASTTNLTITAGTLTAPTHLTVMGNFSNSGTFTNNSGTLYFSSTTAQTISGTLTGSSALSNVNFINSGAKSFSNNASTSNFTIQSGSGAVTAPSGILSVSGNFANSSTFTHNSGTTTFNGSSAQGISGTLIGTSAFDEVSFTGAGTKTFSNNASTSNFFVEDGSSTVVAPTSLSISGNYSNLGVFTHNSGTTTFNGSSAQNLSGNLTGTSAFNDVLFKGGSSGWYNASWNYRVKITVDNTKVDADLTDFPVYVDLSNMPSSFWSNVISGCGDIRVTSSDGTTEVPREIAICNIVGNTGEMYFKASSLANSSNTDFYIYYGNSGASEPAVDATYGAQNVWDSNYVSVLHLDDNPAASGPQQDSTAGNRYATSIALTATSTGFIGDALDLNGTTQYVQFASTTIPYPLNAGTVELWYNPDTFAADANGKYLFTKDKSGTFNGEWRLFLGTDAAAPAQNSKLAFRIECPGGNGTSNVVADIAPDLAGGWYHAVAVWDKNGGASNMNLYWNGTATGTPASPNCGMEVTGEKPEIGRNNGKATPDGYFDGQMDEFRISSTTRSSTWISTGYNNQSSPSTFYSVSAVESPGRTATFKASASTTSFVNESGSTVVAPSNILSISRNYSNLGVFTHNSGTTTFNGTSLQTISGVATGTSAFYNVEITNNSGSDAQTSPSVVFSSSASTTNNFYAVTPNSKIQFVAGATATSSIGNLIINGQDTSTRVTLRSTSAGTPFGLAVTGTRSVLYLNVADSNACSGLSNIDASHASNYDANGNTCWTFPVVGSLSIASGSNKVFEINQSASDSASITITDGGTPSLTANNDLRIAIATSSVDMRWLTTITSATLGGTASGKVSNSITYEGSGSVLVIPINSDFSASDTLTISGLSFTSFGTVVPATVALNIFKDGSGDIVSDATDSATVSIKGKYVLSAHSSGQVSNKLNTTATSITGAEIYQFKLAPTGENFSVTNIVFSLTEVAGIASGHVTNALLYIDYDGDGNVDAGDLGVGGAGSASISGTTGTITFSSSFTATTTRNYILIADVSSVSSGDEFSIGLGASQITSSGATSIQSITTTGFLASKNHKNTGRVGGGSGGGGSSETPPPTSQGNQGGGSQGGGTSGSGPETPPPPSGGNQGGGSQGGGSGGDL